MAQHGLFGKKFQFPLLRNYGPFYAAGAIVFYGVWKLQTAMTDPADPRIAKRVPAAH